ncbi:MAG TPA: type II toxin-antitoxin system VapC family toxin [Candidatus Bathyarchaeia archaeon]|nr:type II toxin-antitoxin system VapC family toxin [Candidatus Bathyarchaeia archaeon]
MRLLLDTQVALWWLIGAKRLSRASRRRIASASCAVSVASIWEVAIKHRLGKLPVAAATFRDGMLDAGATVLPIQDEHAIASAALTLAHPDPFDRLLLATAQVESLRLATGDGLLLDAAAADPSLPVLAV